MCIMELLFNGNSREYNRNYIGWLALVNIIEWETNLIRSITFDGSNQNMPIPAHATPNGKRALDFRVLKDLPTATIHTVMCQTSPTGDGYISPVL